MDEDEKINMIEEGISESTVELPCPVDETWNISSFIWNVSN